jgi:hypothetical protein
MPEAKYLLHTPNEETELDRAVEFARNEGWKIKVRKVGKAFAIVTARKKALGFVRFVYNPN